MSFNRKQKTLVRQKLDDGVTLNTGILDATTTSETIRLGISASKISWQSDGSMTGNISFSINGSDFFDSAAFAGVIPGSYSTHVITAIKVDRISGSGKLTISAS